MDIKTDNFPAGNPAQPAIDPRQPSGADTPADFRLLLAKAGGSFAEVAPTRPPAQSFAPTSAPAGLGAAQAPIGDLDASAESSGAAVLGSTHTVVRGDSLYAIARARLQALGHVDNPAATQRAALRLASVNGISNPNRIYPGNKINLSVLGQDGHAVLPLERPSRFAAPVPAQAPAALAGIHVRSIGTDLYSSAAVPQVSAIRPLQHEDVEQFQVIEDQISVAAVMSSNSNRAPDAVSAVNPAVAFPVPSALSGEPWQETLPLGAAGVAPAPGPAPGIGLPDVVFKGAVGKVLDAIPMDTNTRVSLQQANAIVSGPLNARMLSAITGVVSPVIALAGLVWGLFAARSIEPPSDVKQEKAPQ